MHSYKWWSVFSKWALVATWCIIASPVGAVVNVEGTRVIFNQNDKEAILTLVNSEKQATVVQLWLDEGDPMQSPDTLRSPIVITPPVFRMQPREVRTVRLLLASRKYIADDRESMYWLNIYQIPPTHVSDVSASKQVVLPLRLRMKLFIRPNNVGVLEQSAGDALRFSQTASAAGQQLIITNPTLWHINLTQMRLADQPIGNQVVPPHSQITVPLSAAQAKGNLLQYSVINDEGNRWQYSQSLNR